MVVTAPEVYCSATCDCSSIAVFFVLAVVLVATVLASLRLSLLLLMMTLQWPAGSTATAPEPSAGNGVCTDLASDCAQICDSVQNDCTQPGGIGDFLR